MEPRPRVTVQLPHFGGLAPLEPCLAQFALAALGRTTESLAANSCIAGEIQPSAATVGNGTNLAKCSRNIGQLSLHAFKKALKQVWLRLHVCLTRLDSLAALVKKVELTSYIFSMIFRLDLDLPEERMAYFLLSSCRGLFHKKFNIILFISCLVYFSDQMCFPHQLNAPLASFLQGLFQQR